MKKCIAKLHDYYYEFFGSSELRRAITKVYSGDVLSNIISLAAALLIIRKLPINDYAAYTAFYSILTLIPWLVGNGVNLALVRFSAEHISKAGEKPLELYFISFIFQSVLYLICCIAVLLLSDKATNILFGQKAFNSALGYGLIAGMGLLISQAGRGVYNAEERFGSYVKALWLRQFLFFFIITILFLLKQLNFLHTAQAVIVAELSVAVIVTFHIFRGINISEIVAGIKKQFDIVKEFISSTKWLIAFQFVITSFLRIDVFMLSRFSSEAELANYGVAYRYYSVALILLSSIYTVLLPRFSKVDMQDISRQRDFTFKWLKTTVWIIIPILIFDIFGKSLFVWITGQQYEKAFYMFVIFSIGVWLSFVFSPMVFILISRKEFKFLFVLGVSALVLNFTGNYFLIPDWGGFGAALTVIVSYGLINIASTIRVVLSTK